MMYWHPFQGCFGGGGGDSNTSTRLSMSINFLASSQGGPNTSQELLNKWLFNAGKVD